MPETKTDTRDRILQAAMHLFWKRGYQATSIGDICRSAGVNPGSLYYFFPSKEDLLVAVLTAYIEGIYPGLLEPVWTAVTDPVERIFGLLDVYRRNLIDTEFRYGCPIGNLALEMTDPPERVRALIEANFDAWIGAVEECIAAAPERLPAGVDARSLATHVLTTMEGAVMQARTARAVAPFDASVGHLRAYIEQLMRTSPTRR